MMPVIQIASAFPANFLFPFVVIFISHYNLNPNIASTISGFKLSLLYVFT